MLYLVPMGSPARLTTAVLPLMPFAQSLPSKNSNPGYGSLPLAACLLRVNTLTLCPCDSSFAVNLLPTNPVAPALSNACTAA
jgi:hypothetical protein